MLKFHLICFLILILNWFLKRSTFLSKTCVQRRSSFLAQWLRKTRIVVYGLNCQPEVLQSYQCIQKKSQFGAVYGLVASLGRTSSNAISNFFLSKMQELDLHDMWFLQKGTTCHTARITIYLLSGEFAEHLISTSGPLNWRSISCYLTPFL